jgi:hypothetical protein
MRVGLKPRLEEITDTRRTTGRRRGTVLIRYVEVTAKRRHSPGTPLSS